MSADLFHSNFDLLKLCFSTEYWPWDVQPNKPYAVCPLHKNTNINTQINMKFEHKKTICLTS